MSRASEHGGPTRWAAHIRSLLHHADLKASALTPLAQARGWKPDLTKWAWNMMSGTTKIPNRPYLIGLADILGKPYKEVALDWQEPNSPDGLVEAILRYRLTHPRNGAAILNVEGLAEQAKVSTTTIRTVEAGGSATPHALERLAITVGHPYRVPTRRKPQIPADIYSEAGPPGTVITAETEIDLEPEPVVTEVTDLIEDASLHPTDFPDFPAPPEETVVEEYKPAAAPAPAPVPARLLPAEEALLTVLDEIFSNPDPYKPESLVYHLADALAQMLDRPPDLADRAILRAFADAILALLGSDAPAAHLRSLTSALGYLARQTRAGQTLSPAVYAMREALILAIARSEAVARSEGDLP